MELNSAKNGLFAFLFLFSFAFGTLAAQVNTAKLWVDSIFQQMSPEQKVGQLFMLPAYSNKGVAHEQELLNQVKKLEVGGFIFFQGGPVRQARLTNKLQKAAGIPLMIGMDAEWGLAMRLDSTYKFPWAMTLGAAEDTAALYEVGRQMGLQCKRLGVHWNFAPVLDLNTNPENPIINARSYGELSERVVPRAMAIAKGMEDAGVLACVKHFPGHGDTESDSHKILPTVAKSVDELKAVELKPFREALPHGVSAVMIAHLNVPALTSSNQPTSMSKAVVNDLLRKEWDFQGLTVTDALNMAGAGSNLPPGEVELRAFLAGNDVLLFPRNAKAGMERILKAVRNDTLLARELDERVKRILLAKFRVGLHQLQPLETAGMIADLNSPEALSATDAAAESAVTLLVNRRKTLPWQPSTERVALVVMGEKPAGRLQESMRFYAETDVYTWEEDEETSLLRKLAAYERILVAYYTNGENPWKPYRIPSNARSFLKRLDLQNRYVLSFFGNAYGLNDFNEGLQADALILAYQNHPSLEYAVAQLVHGAIPATGALPVRASANFPALSGIPTEALNILRLGRPEEVGMNGHILHRIDGMMDSAMAMHAFPGAQLLIAKQGQVVYNKAFGYHTYSGERNVQPTDVYDLASITKIAATTLSVMHLYEEEKIALDFTLADHLPMVEGSDKADIVLREMLAHQARLQAWIPFYVQTLAGGSPRPDLYSRQRDDQHSLQVADDLFLLNTYKDSIYQRILDSELRPRREYKYSDLGYYFLKEIIERETRQPLDQFVQHRFYKPMGLNRLTYHPLRSFERDEIVPTEEDEYFRKQLVHGYVHDQGAAMLGGVGGHAGLFANAADLARLMQMFLNKGNYAGQRYLKESTLEEFTRCQFCDQDNRRGVGFDKPQLEGEGPTCGCVSMLSYGHTGFTGTMAWVDPAEEIVYIFLSNRIHPDAENTLLIRSSLRTEIQEVIYKSINP